MAEAANALMIGIDHVQLVGPPGCEANARRFYGELLGLPEVPKPETLRARGGVWFACGAQQVHVGVVPEFSAATMAHPALLVGMAHLDLLAGRLADAGCPVQWDDAIPGTRRFFTADPWGNRIELVGAPGE
jgi:catechol-2,3-dioxygenase